MLGRAFQTDATVEWRRAEQQFAWRVLPSSASTRILQSCRFLAVKRWPLWAAVGALGLLVACSKTPGSPGASAQAKSHVAAANQTTNSVMKDKILKSDDEWKKQLTPEQYEVLRQKGTERPFTGAFWKTHEAGIYRCAGCGQELFLSDAKFDSGCGWPSFDSAADKSGVELREDHSHGMIRTEVVCARCGGHLGHIFDDGPTPTGKRYCINSASLQFEKKK